MKMPALAYRGWLRRGDGSEGVLITSALIVAMLTLLAALSFERQKDPRLTDVYTVIGLLIVLVTAIGFITMQARLVRGKVTRIQHHIAWMIVPLGVFNVWFSFSWTMLGVSAATAMLLASENRKYLAGAAALSVGSIELYVTTDSWEARVGIPLVSLTVAFLLHTLTRLAIALTDLRISREEIARLHVDDERYRISRDLHDLIGRTLVAASLRQQAALHLIDRDTAKAKERLEASHQALADGQAQLRSLTQGPVNIGLNDEIASAQALCERLGIHFKAIIAEELVPSLDHLAARLVREAITNMLKHSRPRNCTIEVVESLGKIELTVTNDGCPQSSREQNGTGLAHLSKQVTALGGSFTFGAQGHGTFRLHVDLPNTSNMTEGLT